MTITSKLTKKSDDQISDIRFRTSFVHIECEKNLIRAFGHMQQYAVSEVSLSSLYSTMALGFCSYTDTLSGSASATSRNVIFCALHTHT